MVVSTAHFIIMASVTVQSHNVKEINTEIEEVKGEVTMETVVKEMHDEFKKRSKILLTNLPSDISEQDIKSLLSPSIHDFSIVSKITSEVRLLFSSHISANKAIHELNGCHYKGHTLSCLYGHPDSLIFIGNLAPWYNRQALHELFTPFGHIIRCIVIYSTVTGVSKCYGFIEYSTKEEAMIAKQRMATKSLNGRSLRVDFADNGMQSCTDLQSCTLFVDRLPKTLKNSEKLKKIFEKYGTVNFCQIALTSAGVSRCFAFIDYSTWESAEKGQLYCNGLSIDNQEIRVSYGMPCRPGACILISKHKPSLLCSHPQDNIIVNNSSNTVTIYNISHQLILPTVYTVTSTIHYEEQHNKENIKPLNIAGAKRTITNRSTSPVHYTTSNNDTTNAASSNNVYDRPYIGQHDQGIQYTHPLKRICTTPT